MVTIKIAIKYTQKEMRKKCKHFATKKIQQTQKKTVMQKKRDKKSYRAYRK